MSNRCLVAFGLLLLLTNCGGGQGTGAGPQMHGAGMLPSWQAGPARDSLIQFVQRVTAEGPQQVPARERIAVFDNDGTLWSEQPMYFQLAFVLDRIKALATEHPEWNEQEPYASILAGDTHAALAGGTQGLLELVMATHSGMSSAEFDATVKQWIAQAKHPTTQLPYTGMVYQPMLELLDHLRANGFRTYIVSGGGIDFMRPWAEAVYGIAPENVIGSTGELALEYRDGEAVLVKRPGIAHVDDGPGKPIAIHRHIGRRPLMAFGNSDGDLEMLQYTAAGSGPRFCMLIHHTDSVREWAYDRTSHIGKLDRALDEATTRNWTVVDMAQDWSRIFPASR
jgi:phosphoserine phosphatase